MKNERKSEIKSTMKDEQILTYEQIKKNEEVRELLKKGNENLGVPGFTDHSAAHCSIVAEQSIRSARRSSSRIRRMSGGTVCERSRRRILTSMTG